MSISLQAQLSTSFLSSCVPLLDLIHPRGSVYVCYGDSAARTHCCFTYGSYSTM